MIDRYYPWGPMQWMTGKLGAEPWSFLGVHGVEDRSTAAISTLSKQQRLTSYLIQINDPNPLQPFEVEKQLGKVKSRFFELDVSPNEFFQGSLLQDIDTIFEHVDRFLTNSGPRIVLDISSMPKRWFFPVIRFLLKDIRVQTLVVTYSSADTYGEQLSSDPLQLGPLPTFDADLEKGRFDELIVGIGFMPLGLRDLYASEIDKIRYLFPFPPGPPNFNRNWKFLKDLETEIENRNLHAEDHWHVHMYDCPSTFMGLCKFTDNGKRTTVLAPFGPKTLSLSMCLFALAVEAAALPRVQVLYTQPRRYALDYSSGIKMIGADPDVKSYLVKHQGQSLYNIPGA